MVSGGTLMGRLKRLLHVSYPSTCNTQQNKVPMVQACRAVAQHTQHTQHTQQAAIYSTTQCTLSQKVKLSQLVSLVADFHQFSNEDRQETLDVALTDPINAITCFTSLAKKSGLLKYLKK
jgi:hypothetical protein